MQFGRCCFSRYCIDIIVILLLLRRSLLFVISNLSILKPSARTKKFGEITSSMVPFGLSFLVIWVLPQVPQNFSLFQKESKPKIKRSITNLQLHTT